MRWAILARRLRGTIMGSLLLLSAEGFSQTATVMINPEADAFVRSADPAGNYGGAGAIAVSGPTSVNASNQSNGAFDSLVRFSTSNVVASLDAALGTQDWLLVRATLTLTEMGAPPHPVFNRGVGAFEIRWLAADFWNEGTGNPAAPATNGVNWNELSSLLNPAMDVTLGQFSNGGIDARLAFGLSLKDAFVSDLRAGGRVTLYLTAVSPQIGFTADSRSFFSSNDIPALEIVGAANPHPRIEALENIGTNALLSFKTVSNWTYVVQVADGLTAVWSNVATFPAQATNGNVTVAEPKASAQRFYRLEISQ